MGWIIFIISLIVLWIGFFTIQEGDFSNCSFWEGIFVAAISWFALLLFSLIITSAYSRTIQTIDYEPVSIGPAYVTDNHCCIIKEDKFEVVEINEVNLSLDSYKPIIKEHLLTAPKWITVIYPSTLFEYTEYELIIPLTAD